MRGPPGPVADPLMFWTTEPMQMTTRVTSPGRQYFRRSQSQASDVQILPSFGLRGGRWICKHPDPSNPHPTSCLLGSLPTGTLSAMEAQPRARGVCRPLSSRLVEHPPPFVFHGDEWLLTPLNKGIISRLRLRGWTRTETGNKSPGSCSTPNYTTKA